MILRRMFDAGSDVLLKGSPTLSPTLRALPWPFFLILSFSQSFFERSWALPAHNTRMARVAAEATATARTPNDISASRAASLSA